MQEASPAAAGQFVLPAWSGSAPFGRLTDPHHILENLAAPLAGILVLASQLAGSTIELVAADNNITADIQLIRDGRRLATSSRQQNGALYEAHRLFADIAFTVQRRDFPALDGRLAWGGCWTGADGCWRVAHFDLAGWRGCGLYRPPGIISGRTYARRKAAKE